MLIEEVWNLISEIGSGKLALINLMPNKINITN